MINVSSAFKQAISNNEKAYLTYADITLANGRVLNLTNEELWEGGYTREEAVSDDNKFTALGATIIGSAELSIKNQHEEYSSYDFTNAKVRTYIALEGVASSKFQTGTYTVDEASYTEASIRLTMLDNMEQFDRPYSKSTLSYPATLQAIVQDACLKCGVSLATTTFPHYSFSIPERPLEDGITFREILGMASAIAGCYCRCTPDGRLQLAWFDRTTLDSWRTAYGRGSTTPGSTYTGMHYLTSLYSQDISVDDIVITGVRCVVEKPDEDGKMQSSIYTNGTTGYVIGIEKNDLLNACTESQINQVVSWLGTQLRGLTFRKASLSHSSDPTIEAGDIAAIWDRRDRGYPILITRTEFSAFSQQKTVCGAETPSRNAATRYGWQTKAYVESKKQLNVEQSIREQLIEEMEEKIANSPGLYKTEVPKSGGGSDIYYHNLPVLEESDIRILISAAGVTVTANGTATRPTWYGLTVDGNMIANILSAIGVDADWITTGTIRSRDGSVQINLDSNTINIKGVTTFSDFETKTNLKTAGSTTINGSNITTGSIKDANSNTVFNLSTGALTMKKGSIDIGDGTFKVDTSGNLTMKKGSINIGSGTFKVDTSGNMTAKNATLTGADVAGKIISTKTTSNHTLKLIIDDADLKGYQGSTLFGHLDLCAQYTDGQAHASLEGVRHLHLEAGSIVHIETGGIGGSGTQVAYADTSGFHVVNAANAATVWLPGVLNSDGSLDGWYRMKVVDGILLPN